MTLAEHKLTPEDVRTTLADIIVSGRATISVEQACDVLSIGRCTGYEATAEGGALAGCTIKIGRRKVVAVPRLLNLLGIPLPEGWQPSGATASRCQCLESEPASVERITSVICPAVYCGS